MSKYLYMNFIDLEKSIFLLGFEREKFQGIVGWCCICKENGERL